MKLKQYLEELLGVFDFSHDGSDENAVKVAYHKNPDNLLPFMHWARGIILPSGDLILSTVKENVNRNTVIHSDIVDWYGDYKGFFTKYEQGADPKDFLNDFLGVVRRSNSPDTFLIGESYFDINPKMYDKIVEYKKAFEKKNPQFKLEMSKE